MRRSALLLLCALAIPALAGCGGSTASSAGTSPSTEAPTSTSPPRVTDDSRDLVLEADDVGPNFTVVPKGTRRVPLSEELKQESAKARAADRRSYLGGYTATYAGFQAIIGSEALTYRNAADAGIVFSDQTGLKASLHMLHGHFAPVPRTYPGAHHLLVLGRVAVGGRTWPAAFYAWRDGVHIELVFEIGPHVGAADAVQLARVQAAREPGAGGSA
jgi:hypothetical protein